MLATQPVTHRWSRAERGCFVICEGDENCSLLPGAPKHHHHGWTWLPYDPIPFTRDKAKTLAQKLLGGALAVNQMPVTLSVECNDGFVGQWAPTVVSDNSLSAWEKPAAPRKRNKTREKRGCFSHCKDHGSGHLTRTHHHHDSNCLPYDVWPYSASLQAIRVIEELGIEPVILQPVVLQPAQVETKARVEPERKSLPRVVEPEPEWLPWEITFFGCPKITYHSEDAAYQALLRFQESTGDEDMEYYECRNCRYWHLGH